MCIRDRRYPRAAVTSFMGNMSCVFQFSSENKNIQSCILVVCFSACSASVLWPLLWLLSRHNMLLSGLSANQHQPGHGSLYVCVLVMLQGQRWNVVCCQFLSRTAVWWNKELYLSEINSTSTDFLCTLQMCHNYIWLKAQPCIHQRLPLPLESGSWQTAHKYFFCFEM